MRIPRQGSTGQVQDGTGSIQWKPTLRVRGTTMVVTENDPQSPPPQRMS